MRKFDLSLRSSRSSYFATFRHQLTILSKLTRWMRRSGLICLARSSRTGLDMSHILFMVEILLLTFKKRISTMNKMWLNMLGTFVKDWFRYESHFVHGRDSLVDILKERGLLSESDAVQPLIGKKS